MSLRYVVLRHELIDEPHFDLMFEMSAASALKTWRASDWPLKTGMVLFPLGDHRREYLDFEGPLTGDRGRVRRVETGSYHIIENVPDRFVATFREGMELKIELTDEIWRCEVNEL